MSRETRARARAVFLDRDGTLVDELGYLLDPRNLRLYPNASQAVAGLREAGYLVILLTNQSALGRGWLTPEGLAEIHAELNRQLARPGSTDSLDAVYVCPHLPGTCGCRKPQPGLVHQAAQDLGLDLGASWVIGDQWVDVETAMRAGCRPILVLTGHGRRDLPRIAQSYGPPGVGSRLWVAEDVLAAAGLIRQAP